VRQRERKSLLCRDIERAFFKRKSVGSRNLESSGLRREISALNFSTRWLIRTRDLILLVLFS
jgi:hypothetical protein